jgi:hypothetical protein
MYVCSISPGSKSGGGGLRRAPRQRHRAVLLERPRRTFHLHPPGNLPEDGALKSLCLHLRGAIPIGQQLPARHRKDRRYW